MSVSKAPCAAVTMVHQEDFFLRRWIAHYRQVLPDDNIYVINHGGDPRVRAIAEGVNVYDVPLDPTRSQPSRRRWQFLSDFASSLTQFYHWVICNDVDELIILDPEVGDNLVNYLMASGVGRQSPQVLIPLAVEMIHVPKLEPELLEDGSPIIGRRRIYRLNSNYCKPCMTRRRLRWGNGGHGSDYHEAKIDTNLLNFHLRFIDFDIGIKRFQSANENRFVGKTPAQIGKMLKEKRPWASNEKTLRGLSKREPVEETIAHPTFVEAMRENGQVFGDILFMGGGRPRVSYRLPERFNGVF
jgi:hypothetical protein